MNNCCIKYLFFFILSSLISLSWQLFGSIVIIDCNGKKMDTLRDTIAISHKKKAETIINEINSTNCLKKDWNDLINSSYNSNKYETKIQLTCDPNFKCGEADHNGNEITIPKYYSQWQSSCGCEEATLLHEMLHSWALVPDTPDGEKKISGCEVKCTANIPRCQKYPPPGQACDCPK